MLDSLLSGTLVVHVAGGVVALLAGAVAIGTEKGGRRHRRFGRVYVAAMAVVVVTAVPLALVEDDYFLFAIAVFSGYLVFAGYRVLARKRPDGGSRLDYAGHGTMVLAGAGMVAWGSWGTVSGTVSLGPVLVVFGLIGGVLALREIQQLRTPPSDPMAWFFGHLALMGGGYIATVTAAVTVNLTVLPPLVRWLGPTAIGTPLLVYAARRYEAKFSGASAGAEATD
jgi:uncharacterized membrane protein